MKAWVLALCAILVMIGCAPYKYLKPRPEVVSSEGDYIPLQRKGDFFMVKGGKKYVVSFPPAEAKNFYLVLKMDSAEALKTYFTRSYQGRKGRGEPIADQSPFPGKMSVYAISPDTGQYYWMVDAVDADKMELKVEYRYVPQWRFKFENSYEAFSNTLEQNRQDRSIYEAIGPEYDFSRLPFEPTITSLDNSLANLDELHQKLLAIDSLFPPEILESDDEAVKNYQALRSQLREELEIQNQYRMTLDFFDKSLKARAPVAAFVENSGELDELFRKRGEIRQPILTRARSVVEARMNEVAPYYEGRLSRKRDDSPIDSMAMAGLEQLDTLCSVAKLTPPSAYIAMARFARGYNSAAKSVRQAQKKAEAMMQKVKAQQGMPDDGFYRTLASEAQAVKESFPGSIVSRFGTYGTYPCAQALDRRLQQVGAQVATLADHYGQAARLVPQLTAMFKLQDYRTMLALLSQQRHLTFLLEQYKEIDRYSLQQQVDAIRSSIDAGRWRETESRLRELHQDNNFLNMAAMAPLKGRMVGNLEEALYAGVEQATKSRARAFVKSCLDSVHNVEALYEDSAFLPVHHITFTSGDPQKMRQHQNEMERNLTALKHVEFPATAIKHLYESLTANPADNGVLKARAIVAHGKQYQGEDRKIKNRMHESNPWIAKWITKPKTYRRVFALPITSNRRGVNTYVLRLNVRIKSEAKFPVYDINIKLPRTVAEKAGSEQWFEQISLNKQVIKNEGRHTITAPTAKNGYECQVTPVRMEKDDNNYLEIKFTHPSFTVLPISVMAQKPLIKKN